jgi:hypothetical protein
MLTEYERKREARIARNRAILLALVGDLPTALTTTPSPPPRARVKAKEKRARIAIDLEDLRRSDRVRRLPARVYTTFERDEDLGDDAARRRAASDLPKPKPKPKPTRVAAVATASAKAKSPAAPPAKGSIKTLVVRARAFAANHLGASIGDGTGAKKAAVIHALAAPRRDARFSKYSGIQEFKNVVCLFVNVGDKNGNAYDNVFTHAGGRITWFAQPRQTEVRSRFVIRFQSARSPLRPRRQRSRSDSGRPPTRSIAPSLTSFLLTACPVSCHRSPHQGDARDRAHLERRGSERRRVHGSFGTRDGAGGVVSARVHRRRRAGRRRRGGASGPHDDDDEGCRCRWG